jgi:cation transport ATPase
MFRDRFWITLLLSVPTLGWSGMVQEMAGFRPPAFPGSRYVPALFGIAVYLYGGSVFVTGGIRELRDRLPGMMTLISLAITVAFVFSLAMTLGYPGEALWWELASLVTIMLLGHWIEMRSIARASRAVRELARLLPSTAQRLIGETIEEVSIAALREGDLVLVRPGASVPASTYLLTATNAVAAFAIADAVRPESRDAVQRLHEQRVEVVMLTGDARAVEAVAGDLGIDTVFAEVLPGDKVDRIKELKAHGKRVAMVGDGVNDAPALLTADVAVAIGAGTDVAVEAGDVVLVRSDPRDVPRIIALSRASYRKMVQNLWWAAGYNIVAIPLAAGVLASRGVLLPPAFAAVLMSASTVIVAINAQLLRPTRL